MYEISISIYQMGFRNELEIQFRTGESIDLASFNLINIKTCSKISLHVDCCLVDEACRKAREINSWGRYCVSFNIVTGCRTIIFTTGNKTIMSLEACQAFHFLCFLLFQPWLFLSLTSEENDIQYKLLLTMCFQLAGCRLQILIALVNILNPKFCFKSILILLSSLCLSILKKFSAWSWVKTQTLALES